MLTPLRIDRLFPALAALALLSGPAVAQGGPPPGGAPAGPTEVGVMELTLEPVARSYTIPGRAVAFEETQVRPRVGGVVTEILYSPGRQVEVGTPLFRLDSASYEAARSSAEAMVAKAEAVLNAAETTLTRLERLEGTGATTADVDSARASVAEARADVQSAEADLQIAESELSWTEIASPISGIADVSQVSVGDLVTAGQTDALTTITRLDPIYVDMTEPSSRILSMRDDIDSGALTVNDKLQVSLTLESGKVYSGTGTLVSPGFAVSSTTGTVGIRFQFDNPRRMILPGMFVRGEVVLGTSDAILVPQRAATRGRDGTLTAWVVGEGSLAEQVSLTESGSFENAWIITSGVAEGDQLIVDGLSNLRAGAEVSPVPVTLDADGVVSDAAEAAPADAVAPAPAEAAPTEASE
ncbi:efflux RND transporter periplasmic adaptor subunit [Frigidibacter sp.]|uniref:efflux RND transporter periplasmic adaptor subunit n=1 Tax=Frigidibacter sp. TaxID=2586418 RepID=UPI0027369126|nr:efflux RND transporter periplasmic adaptor subunit [Frigidibacter sp.]MDP3339231.1 efflux RND transporter periplasmic adaptor subunit [Frigidibacter sp.]